MARLRLYLLGTPRIELDDREVRPAFRKALALLVYLGTAKEKQRRESLMNLLWPDQDEANARSALRRAVYAIRRSIPGPWLYADRDGVGLLDEPGLWCDVDEFLDSLLRASGHAHQGTTICDTCRSLLEGAVRLYRGDFLSGFGLGDSENFDDWQYFQTEKLRQELAGALDTMTRCCIAAGGYSAAEAYARRWLALDPLNEAAHRSLMRIGAWSGNRAAALRQYRECARLLDSDLGVAPQESTRTLFEAIREDRLEFPHRDGDARVGEPSSRTEPAAGPGDAQPRRTAVDEPAVDKRFVTTAVLGLRETVDHGRPESAGVREPDVASIRAFQIAARSVIERYGGAVNHMYAERVLAIFGGNQTRESDPELALCAALEIGRMARPERYRVAGGISAGWAYFADSSVVGSAVSAASRLYETADPGRILIDESVYRHTRLGFETVPGVAGGPEDRVPSRWHEVMGRLSGSAKTRGIEGLRSPLVGRSRDVADLEAVAGRWLAGQGQIAVVCGEAGIGKSRLVAEVISSAKAKRKRILCLQGRCVASGQPIAYWPFLDILRTYFGIGDGEANEEILRKIAAGVRTLNMPSEIETTAYVAKLLSARLEAEAAKELEHKSPEQIRDRTLVCLRNLFENVGRRTRLLLVLEDLHWADDLSFDLLTLLLDSLPSSAVFIFCLFRLEAGHRTAQLSIVAQEKCPERFTEVGLNRLHKDETRQMVEHLLGGARIPATAVELISRKSEGIPFFVEEIVRSLIEKRILQRRGDEWEFDGSGPGIDVPDSIQSVISARIGMLPAEDRTFLQYASVIGRFFKLRLMHAFAENDRRLADRVRSCTDRGLIYAERTVPEVEYAFRHAFTQEATYEEIPERARKRYHGQVAADIERLYADRIEEWYEALAQHYSRSESVDSAIEYLLKAGRKALERSDLGAAVAFLKRGLEFADLIADGKRRRASELECRIVLGGALAAARGYTSSDVADNYGRARELCLEADSTARLFDALHGLASYYLVKGDYRSSFQLGAEQKHHAQQLGDSAFHLEAHLVMGLTEQYRGRLGPARHHIERTLSLYNKREHGHLAFLYGHDPAVAAMCQHPVALWVEGYPDRARELCVQCLEHARGLNHPPSLGMACAMTPIAYQCRGESETALKIAEEAIGLSAQYGLPLWALMGSIMRAWVRSTGTGSEDELRQFRQIVETYRSSGIEILGSYYTMLLAERLAGNRSAAEGLDCLSVAFALMEKNDERLFEAELHRLRGELLRRKAGQAGDSQGGDEAAEACLLQALDVARSQGARSLELRSAVSLGLLRQDQGREREARMLVKEARNQMTEGFDTRDLVEASTFLDALS